MSGTRAVNPRLDHCFTIEPPEGISPAGSLPIRLQTCETRTQVILRELSGIKIGDILMKTTEGQELVRRRVARPKPAQARILEALNLTMPERLTTPDRIL